MQPVASEPTGALSTHMRLLLAFPLAGCSLIYNPSSLPERNDAGPDSNIDAEVVLDANPAALELEKVRPAVLIEATGSGGGRQAVITVHGKHLVAGAKIEITAHAGETVMPRITVDDANTAVADNGFIVAAPIVIDFNPDLAKGARLRLDVTVTQPDGNGGMVTRTLSELATPDAPALELEGLDELSVTGNHVLPSGTHEFSQVNITGTLGAMDNANALVVRSRGSLTIGGLVSVDASGTNPGPGGALGGNGGLGDLLNPEPGGPGGGPGAGQPSGGGGGFGTAGTAGTTANTGGPAAGFASIPDFTTNRGSGGAGGNGTTVNSGGNGGAGGGVVELTAGGALDVNALSAIGGSAPAEGNNRGGGGSGGAVLLRGSVVTIATGITLTGGTGPGNGGEGGLGRARIDVPTTDAIANSGGAFRGAMVALDTPLIVRAERPQLTVVGQPNSLYSYFFTGEDATGTLTQTGVFNGSIGAQGSNPLTLEAPLFRGHNTLCLLVSNADFQAARPEARNCIEIAYLMKL